MNEHHRRPAAFRLDDPKVVVTTEAGRAARGTVRVMVEPEPSLPAVQESDPLQSDPPPRRGFGWSTLFWCALGGLVALGMGLSVTHLIEDLFGRNQELGWLGVALAGLAGLAFAVIVLREAFGLWRLRSTEKLRERSIETLASDDRAAAPAVVRDALPLARPLPRLAPPRARPEGHLEDIIDGADLVRLAERELMEPLDRDARRIVSDAAKRVSLVTAVSPRALVDVLFVLASASVVRRLAYLYGGRPGTLGVIRLMREVVAHLALTGGMAAGDSLIQQVLGHGIAAKVRCAWARACSTASSPPPRARRHRGDATAAVCRLAAPTLSDVAGNLLRRDGAFRMG